MASAGTLVHISRLAEHPQALPELKHWFETEWADHYGADGPGDARADLQAFAQVARLPLGLVAHRDGQLCGIAALKAESIPSHRHLGPWAAAGLVRPDCRGQGIGASLLRGLEHEARTLGHWTLYCATGTAGSLLVRQGWKFMAQVDHDNQHLGLYCKVLV